MLTTAITNLKGGVGKTATTLGLAGAASARGLRTLVIDLDPQANATLCLAPGLDVTTALTIRDLVDDDQVGTIPQAITSTGWRNVDLVPSQLQLDTSESKVGPTMFHRLSRALTVPAGLPYDLVLIDCRPSVGVLVTNALVAADRAVIVTAPERASIRGVAEAARHIAEVNSVHNTRIRLAGVIVNKVDLRKSEEAYRLTEIRDAYGPLVWEPTIPDRTVIAQAFGAGVPVTEYPGQAAREVTTAYDAHLTHLLASENLS